MQKVTMDMQKVSEIQTHELFENLFPIDAHVLKQIEDDMRDGNYDFSQPVILANWKGQKEQVCIDGHTRLQAARNIGITEVPVWLHELDTEEEALERAIKLQSNRRNMTDREIATCIETLDKKKPRGGDRRSEEAKSKASSDAIEKTSSKSAKETADLLGISATKVERIRNVLSNGDPDTIEAVKNGEISANKAYQKTRKNLKKTKTESTPTNAAKKAADEDQELEKTEECKRSPGYRPVFLSVEHFGALHQLGGGSVEDHLDIAVERYLESFQEQHEHNSSESGEENEDDNKCLDRRDNQGCSEDATDSGDADKKEDDEEYFDPADYEDD